MHFSLLFKILVLAAFLLGCSLSQVQGLSTSYQTFQDQDVVDFIRYNSYIVLNAIQVTPDVNGASIANMSGRSLYQNQFKLWRQSKGQGITRASFNSTFVINISSKTFPGGEGLAFIIAADHNLPPNSEGQWLGIVNADTNGSASASIVAVEFDTRKSYAEDLDDNHVGLDVNSIYSIKQVSLSGFGLNVSAGNDTLVEVMYDGQNLTVFVSLINGNGVVVGKRNQAFSEPIDLSAYLPKNVYVGFSASTSNFTELNCVKSWEFQSSDIGDDQNLLWVYITVPLGTILVMSIAFFLCWKLRYGKKQPVDSYEDVEEEIKGSSMAPQKFRLRDLKKATGNFNLKNKLGKGGFGTVYKGTLDNKEVAVKRISKKSTQGKQEFIAEVKTIGNLNHKHLVKLIGWCYESREFLLVYEFMPNSSLDKYIFNDKNFGTEGSMSTMKWETRVSVIYGVAQALDYLHNGCKDRVLHRDIKASNIMLDSEFNAKLGDFGLARTILKTDQTHHSTKEIAGTPGYMAPESILTGRATVETDVYAFGVLVMEVVCGRKPGNQILDNDYSSGIANWLWELYGYGRILEAVDPKLEEQYQADEVECMLLLGLACCHPNPHQRPSMKTVLQVLTGEAPPPNVPAKRPLFMWPPMPPSFADSEYSLATGQLTPFSDIDGR